jgi:hypothetical protein
MYHKLSFICPPRFWGFDASPPSATYRLSTHSSIKIAVPLKVAFQWFGFFIERNKHELSTRCKESATRMVGKFSQEIELLSCPGS